MIGIPKAESIFKMQRGEIEESRKSKKQQKVKAFVKVKSKQKTMINNDKSRKTYIHT